MNQKQQYLFNKNRLRRIIAYMKVWAYTIYREPHKLNLVGLRNANTVSDSFDDIMLVFWYTDTGKLEYRTYKQTTDPSTHFLKNPMDAGGAAIMKGGQYLDSWTLISTARFGFAAKEFMQIRPITILRDNNRDNILDFWTSIATTGLYGINMHTGAGPGQKSVSVGLWSAGCQAMEEWSNWLELISLAERHIALYGNLFSYTLLDEKASQQARVKNGLLAIIFLLLLLAWYCRQRLIDLKNSLYKPPQIMQTPSR